MDLLLLTAVAAACGSSPEQLETSDHAVIGQCTRNEPVLRGPAIDCAIDADCPCGSHCDSVEPTCAFECMIPPAGPTEACATGTQCDDAGRCVGPSQGPPGTAPVLTANPPALITAPGGPALSTQVRLAAFTQSAVGGVGTASGSLTLFTETITGANKKSTRTIDLELQLDLTGQTTTPGTYTGTLNLRAVTQ